MKNFDDEISEAAKEHSDIKECTCEFDDWGVCPYHDPDSDFKAGANHAKSLLEREIERLAQYDLLNKIYGEPERLRMERIVQWFDNNHKAIKAALEYYHTYLGCLRSEEDSNYENSGQALAEWPEEGKE